MRQDTRTIKTDNKWKLFLYSYDLTPKEKKEFDYMDEDDFNCATFIRYRHWVYSLDDFMRLDRNSEDFNGWDGYHGDSFYSGVLIKLSSDGDAYKIGTYIN